MRLSLVLLCLLLAAPCLGAARAPAFSCIVEGCAGGVTQDNLSCYLLAPAGASDYVALDAGTLRLQPAIHTYLVSHAHLDHVAGLVIASTDDAKATVVGLDPTIDVLRDDLFNWRVWPNMGSEGTKPLGHYVYQRVKPMLPFTVSGSSFRFEAWPLSHGGVTSTAFLVFRGDDCVAYLGDSGPDAVEKTARLDDLWKRLAPVVRAGHLRAIFIEASYPDGRPDKLLFGHLTPAWLLAELHAFAQAAGSLQGLEVVVTHLKPDSSPGTIARQLQSGNDMGVKFRVPRQGDRFDL